jgi:hypothetical protein
MDISSFGNPLRVHTANDDKLRALGHILWGWKYCGQCPTTSWCPRKDCPWNVRAIRLERFWRYYKIVASSYTPDLTSTHPPALTDHDELLAIIEAIKTHQDVARADVVQEFFGKRYPDPDPSQRPSLPDQDCAFNVGASILFQMNVSHGSANIVEESHPAFPWRKDISAKQYVQDAFPNRQHPYFEGDHEYEMRRKLAALTAVQLRKRTGLRIKATSDLRCHLMLDQTERVVQVFHCTPVLKEILLQSKDDPDASIIPRPLALEVLRTLHDVLFPSDHDSQALISELVTRESFDEGLKLYELESYRRDDDPDVSYTYFGSRLADLYDLPPPWEGWFTKNSRPGYMLMITMVGVIITVIIGFVGLGLVGVQTWIAWQQWRHPVETS